MKLRSIMFSAVAVLALAASGAAPAIAQEWPTRTVKFLVPYGPGGGTEDKPVGTVWVAWKRRGGYPRAEVFHFEGDRDAVRRQTVAAALRGLEHQLA